MNSRKRVLAALRHQEPDRVPIDLDGMRSTGIMAVAYNRLKAHLGIADGETKMYDIMQQLAHPEPPILERFGVDVLPLPRASWGLDPANPAWKPWALPDGLADHYTANLPRYLDAVGDYVQIIQMGDDLGTQRGPQMSPRMYRQIIKPAHRQVYEYVKAHSGLYIFLHTCGSIYRLIPDLIEVGVDILNPVQISAAEMDPVRLKREFGQDVVFWGGGADTQHVLPNATPEEVRQHVRELIEVFAPGSGYVFCQVHNIQANVPPENVVTMFETALEFGRYS